MAAILGASWQYIHILLKYVCVTHVLYHFLGRGIHFRVPNHDQTPFETITGLSNTTCYFKVIQTVSIHVGHDTYDKPCFKPFYMINNLSTYVNIVTQRCACYDYIFFLFFSVLPLHNDIHTAYCFAPRMMTKYAITGMPSCIQEIAHFRSFLKDIRNGEWIYKNNMNFFL